MTSSQCLSLAAQEANRLKDYFIATLSHELRTPVNAVLGWMAILKQAFPDPPACERAMAAIERNARIQAQLLNDALDIDRIVRGQLTLTQSDHELVTVVAEVLETVRPAAVEKGITVVEQVSGSPRSCSIGSVKRSRRSTPHDRDWDSAWPL